MFFSKNITLKKLLIIPFKNSMNQPKAIPSPSLEKPTMKKSHPKQISYTLLKDFMNQPRAISSPSLKKSTMKKVHPKQTSYTFLKNSMDQPRAGMIKRVSYSDSPYFLLSRKIFLYSSSRRLLYRS